MTTGSRVLEVLRPTTPDVGAVARSLLVVLAMAAVALLTHSPQAAIWTAGAAAVAGAVGLQDGPDPRVPLVLVVSVQLGAAVCLGALTSFNSVLFVGVVAAWCFAAGMQWALGGHAGLVGVAASALLVIAVPGSPSVSGVLVPTALAVAGGWIQAALLAVWPPHRWRVRRSALSAAYRSLAADARSVAADRDAPVDAAPFTSLREAFLDGPAPVHRAAYRGGYRLPERITATLAAMRGGHGDALERVLTAAAELLDAVADHGHGARRDAESAVVRVDAAVELVTGPDAPTAQRFAELMREAVTDRFGDFRRVDLAGSLSIPWALVRDHLTPTSPVLRHAVRLSVATGLAVAAARFAPIEHGYWIALTVLMVLRPETAHTYTRCIGRIGGIAGGVLVASLITLLWQPTGSTAALVAVVFFAVTYSVLRFGYLAVSVALAIAAEFLLDIDAAATTATLEDRLFAVVIGGGLAVVTHVVLPDDAMVRLRQRAGELLKAEIDYAATVVNAYVHQLDRPGDALSAAWQRAYRARTAFEAASGAARPESGGLRQWLRSYRGALNAVTSACTSLENSLPAAPSPGLSREFVAAVDDYVNALRGAPPTPATPWTVDVAELSAAGQQLRERGTVLAADDVAARVLVAEVATITRSLSRIAASREPTSAG